MEPVIIYTDAYGNDVGAVRSFALDLAFGADEQSFECAFFGVNLTGGEYLYIDGTEYGGIIDQYTQATNSNITTYIGRTWHGILAGKILKPESGYDYYSLSGDANECIRAIIQKTDLGAVFTGRNTQSGISVNYQFTRFCNAYEGLLKMLASANAVLKISRHDGMTEIWAESANTITDEADSDVMDFTVTRANRVVNHLVCAGEGELQSRVVVDLYADASGNVSQTQTLFGIDEVALYYNYSGADQEELLAEGAKKLKEYQTNGGADIGRVGAGDWCVGDRLQVRDNRTGIVVTAIIAKKIVKVSRGVLTVDYEVGDHVAAQAASFDANLSGIAEQPKPLTAKSAVTAESTIANIISQTSAQATSYAIPTAEFRQYGRIAMVAITFVPASNSSSAVQIGTLLTGRRPIVVAGSNLGYIGADGALTVDRSLSANQSYVLSATYILA